MRKSLAIALFMFILFGCKKDASTPPPPSFKFKANGTLYQSTNSPGNEPQIQQLLVYSQLDYYFNCQISNPGDPASIHDFNVSIDVDSLIAGDYSGTVHSDVGVYGNVFINAIWIPETNCSYYSSIAQASITITRASDGTADGIFSGSDIRTGGTCGDRTILYTEGEFKNVKVIH